MEANAIDRVKAIEEEIEELKKREAQLDKEKSKYLKEAIVQKIGDLESKYISINDFNSYFLYMHVREVSYSHESFGHIGMKLIGEGFSYILTMKSSSTEFRSPLERTIYFSNLDKDLNLFKDKVKIIDKDLFFETFQKKVDSIQRNLDNMKRHNP